MEPALKNAVSLRALTSGPLCREESVLYGLGLLGMPDVYGRPVRRMPDLSLDIGPCLRAV